MRRTMLDGVNDLNRHAFERLGDPSISSRIDQYEMAFRMQASVPELTDLSNEPTSTYELYGDRAKEPGTYAYNCLMARRMAERGVRFTQIFLRNWDHHLQLPKATRIMAEDSDRPTYALITDLKRRGMLDDTLVIWGGEFGRTVYSQGNLTKDDYGRDHHPRCFSMWMAGGGIKPGIAYGETDDFSYNIVKDPVHIRDLHATLLYLFGLNHEKLTFKFQGLDQKLTGVIPARSSPEYLPEELQIVVSAHSASTIRLSVTLYFICVGLLTLFGIGAAMLFRPAFSYSIRSAVGLEKPLDPAADSFYAVRVGPLFEEYCVGCHGERRQKGDLRLDSFAAAMRGGKHGSIIIKGEVKSSELMTRLTLPPEHDKAMPPSGKPPPSADEVKVIKLWIDAGASGALPYSVSSDPMGIWHTLHVVPRPLPA